jgi:hypothetical protein
VPAFGRHRDAVDADGEAAQNRDLDPHRWILLPEGRGKAAGRSAV